MNNGANTTMEMLQDEGPPQSVEGVVRRLKALREELGQNNADRAVHVIRETAAALQDRRTHHGPDLFTNCRSTTVTTSQADSRKIKFKVSLHKLHKSESAY